MKEQFLAKIGEIQAAAVVTSYGGDDDTRISPRIVTAVYRGLVTVMYYPPVEVPA